MAGTRQILNRLKATRNINRITHTMETISAVRYRHFYKKWSQSKAFYDNLAQLAYLIVTAQQTIQHPLMLSNNSDCNAILIIGSDRGLCGGYNGNITRLVDVHVNMSRRFGRKLKIYARGNKILSYLRHRGLETAGEYSSLSEVPTVEEAKRIAEDFAGQYAKGQIGRFGIVYTDFYSVASQHAQTLTLLPITELIDDLTTRATVIWPWELAFEDFLMTPSAEEIFDSLAMMMLRTAISGCFLDAVLSEHLGRVVAMRNATDNADEMIDLLKKDYNRARQGQITTELLDIIAGVS